MNLFKKLILCGAVLSACSFGNGQFNNVSASRIFSDPVLETHKKNNIINSETFYFSPSDLNNSFETVSVDVVGIEKADNSFRSKVYNDLKDFLSQHLSTYLKSVGLKINLTLSESRLNLNQFDNGFKNFISFANITIFCHDDFMSDDSLQDYAKKHWAIISGRQKENYFAVHSEMPTGFIHSLACEAVRLNVKH